MKSMAFNAGTLDRRLRVQPVEVDHYGTPIGYGDVSAPFAVRRRDVSDAERAQHGGLSNKMVTRFVARSSTLTRSITHSDRLIHEGVIFEITGIKEVPDRRRAFLEFTAESSGVPYVPAS